jgi:DNA-binding beta-propeller fold protein YncE
MAFSDRSAALLALAFFLAPAQIPSAAAQTGPATLQSSGVINRLLQQTGVYNKSPTGTTPSFVADPAWPAGLPNSWIVGQVAGLFVDGHDHVWALNRPRTLTNVEAGLEKMIPGAVNAQGLPVNGFGQVRQNGFGADCCAAAPAVMEFDSAGKLLRSWGGPADPDWLAKNCRAEQGCIWPNSEHGIYVDQQDNVWIAGNAANVPATPMPWTTHRQGGDGFVLKFDMDGNFKLRIGGTPTGPSSNDTNGGYNGTPNLFQPADMVVDPRTNRLYISDGYGNRRVLIVDATTGRYIGHFGAYGSNPVDDAAASAAGPWPEGYARGERRPAFFRTPVHCVKIAADGKIYVCDRGNNRIQVFDGNDPNLGKPCANPQGEVARCGYLAERAISEKSYTQPAMPGTAVSMNFSTDKAQSCLYVGDNTNQTIYILNRGNLQELGRLGRNGRMTGEFNWLHQVSVDSRGNVYTAEVDQGKRIQKFLRYGPLGCSGTGSETVGGVAGKSLMRVH